MRKQCSVCLKKSSKTILCPLCQAVYYCSDGCLLADLEKSDAESDCLSHKFWCSKALQYRTDIDIITFPFSWATEDWRDIKDPFVLPSESLVLDDHSVTPPNSPLTSWSDYYDYRGFHVDSPIAILLQWPLTVYYILTTCFPHGYPGIQLPSARIEIHCVGAAKEASMVAAFTELSVLLPHESIHVRFVGPDVPKRIDGRSFQTESRLSCSFHHGMYHEIALPSPDLVIGFNAGLVAYTSWIETVHMLAASKIPAFFTDYCWKSYALTKHQFQDCRALRALSDISVGQLNPFRSPIRISDLQSEIPAFSNAVLFHLHYDVGVGT